MGSEATGAGRALASSGVPAGRTLARLSRHLDTALAPLDLTLAQYRVLALLSEEGSAAAASRLADRLRVSRPAVTTLVDGLVAKGLVRRRPATDDRRRVDHLLTPAGVRELERADQVTTDRLGAIAMNLDAVQRDDAMRGLESWSIGLDQFLQSLVATANDGDAG